MCVDQRGALEKSQEWKTQGNTAAAITEYSVKMAHNRPIDYG